LKPNKEKALQPSVNEFIRASRVQLITHNGENVGVIQTQEALRMAQEVDLDLVLISPEGKDGIPVAKIMDYGKQLYEKKKKLAESKKHQKTIQVKEIKIRPKIGEHDFQTKVKHAFQFLDDGKHVKVTLMFRGREQATIKERAPLIFEKFEQILNQQYNVGHLAHEKETRSGSLWSRIYYIAKRK